MTSKLSPDLQVACEIYKHNINKDPIWYSKLVEIFEGRLTQEQVTQSLLVLTDWILIYGEYGETEKGRAGYCYFIDGWDGASIIPELYEKYWKDEKK